MNVTKPICVSYLTPRLFRLFLLIIKFFSSYIGIYRDSLAGFDTKRSVKPSDGLHDELNWWFLCATFLALDCRTRRIVRDGALSIQGPSNGTSMHDPLMLRLSSHLGAALRYLSIFDVLRDYSNFCDRGSNPRSAIHDPQAANSRQQG
jgi:hypothetical protein